LRLDLPGLSHHTQHDESKDSEIDRVEGYNNKQRHGEGVEAVGGEQNTEAKRNISAPSPVTVKRRVSAHYYVNPCL